MENIRFAAVIKKVLFILLFAVGTAGITYGAVDKTESSKKIKIKGDNGGNNGDESSPRSEPIIHIEAYIYTDDAVIESFFNIEMGVVTLTVEDAAGIILIESTIDTSVCRDMETDIAGLASGDYTINYLTGDGVKFYGEFTIE